MGRSEVQIALRRVRSAIRYKGAYKRKNDTSADSWRRYSPPQHPFGAPSPPAPFTPPENPSGRNIRLGLERVQKVVPHQQKWLGVHVGGTNGKGSIVAFLAGLFKLAGLSHGTYTSPAFPERHHGVTINGLVSNRGMYESHLQMVQTRSKRLLSPLFSFANFEGEDQLGDITPFELETVTAFEIFNYMRIKYGIVEVGMGGMTDATNIIKDKAVTVISKIDLDHQEYLGRTLKEIARVKAGIMRPQVPCIVDHTNTDIVKEVLQDYARAIGCSVIMSDAATPLLDSIDTRRFQLEDYQKQNLLCALAAFQRMFPSQQIDVNRLLDSDPYLPGRLEKVDISDLTLGFRSQPILADGAHNMLGVENLAVYVKKHVRQEGQPITWVMAMSASKSKPFAKLIEMLVKPGDNFAFVEFQQGPNDPAPVPAQLGRDVAQDLLASSAFSTVYRGKPTVVDALKWAATVAMGRPIVATGSLYMVRDLLRLDGVRSKRFRGSRRPGRAQLLRYVKLKLKRGLSMKEEMEFKRARRHWYLAPHGPVRRKYEEVEGITEEWPPRVPQSISKLQREVRWNEEKLQAYQAFLSNINEDSFVHDEQATRAEAPEPTDVAQLDKSETSSLMKQHTQQKISYHQEAYEAAKKRLQAKQREHTILVDRRPLTPRSLGERRHDTSADTAEHEPKSRREWETIMASLEQSLLEEPNADEEELDPRSRKETPEQLLQRVRQVRRMNSHPDAVDLRMKKEEEQMQKKVEKRLEQQKKEQRAHHFKLELPGLYMAQRSSPSASPSTSQSNSQSFPSYAPSSTPSTAQSVPEIDSWRTSWSDSQSSRSDTWSDSKSAPESEPQSDSQNDPQSSQTEPSQTDLPSESPSDSDQVAERTAKKPRRRISRFKEST